MARPAAQSRSEFLRANKGIVVGLMKDCLGLSSAILSRVWRLFFLGSDGSSFLLVATILPSTVACLLMPIVRKYDPVHNSRNDNSSTTLNWAMAFDSLSVVRAGGR
ncbi:hypothetical protein KI387_029879 [Taxus chinensis]|uniref:Nodulin-like domain-containing protein n=1 Tax=Taxus chinensis TaxID=29808 RepID=A0AA38FE08_TAXCH|nr:hypothetical protein KI387_029879 [Taxus chinensis]